MNRKNFLQLGLLPLFDMDIAAQQTIAQVGQVDVNSVRMHLDVWAFELRLNSFIPKKSIFEINPHTRSYLAKNIHLALAEAGARLEKDITLLLVIKENPFIAEKALAAGLKVNENSFHKDEWPAWVQLLKKLTDEQPTK